MPVDWARLSEEIIGKQLALHLLLALIYTQDIKSPTFAEAPQHVPLYLRDVSSFPKSTLEDKLWQ